MIGSNDVNDVMNLTKGSGLDAAKTLAGTRATSAVGSLIDDINSTIGNDGQKFGGQIFVGTVPPFENGTNYTVDENEVAKSWNIAVETLISDEYANSNVHFVDMWKQSAPYVDPFTGEKDTVGGLTQRDITDFGSKIGQDQCGCHPTYDGYIKIAKHWYAALQQVVPELNPGYAPLAKLLSGGALAEARPDLNQGDAGLSTLSLELQEYLPSVQGGQPLVGFDGADLGQGKGDGVDEVVAFSFTFPAYTAITSAQLILDLTPKNDLITTDRLLFADDTIGSVPTGTHYGNDQLKDLTVDKRATVNFDLLSFVPDPKAPTPADWLKDGDLNVVYTDDAIIHSARLVVRGTIDPFGPPGNDTIKGEGEADSIYAGAGDDSVIGGAFADWLNGESGNDTLLGNAYDDTLYGGTGNDSLLAGDGDDVIVGGDNNDTLDGQNGNDTIYGDLGDERYEGNDVINGGNGEDQVLGGGGSDTVYGGLDDDWLNGQWGSDRISGDGGNDVIIGEDGNDTLYGGSGDDYFLAGKGGDYVTGGAGNDTITFEDILQTSKLYGFDKIRGFDNPGPQAGDVIDLSPIDARPDIDGNQAFKLVPADKPQWGGIWVFDHSWDNSTMVQGWIGPTPYAPHGDWFQFWILDGPDVHARDYTAEDFVL